MSVQQGPVLQAVQPSLAEQTVAMEAILACFPSPRLMVPALALRGDGSSVGGILAGLELLRTDLQARLGRLMEASPVKAGAWPEVKFGGSVVDAVSACQIVIGLLPVQRIWTGALATRGDGTTLPGILVAINNYRKELQALMSDLPDDEPAVS